MDARTRLVRALARFDAAKRADLFKMTDLGQNERCREAGYLVTPFSCEFISLATDTLAHKGGGGGSWLGGTV